MSTQNTLNLFNKIYNETYEDVLKYVICNSSNLEDVNDIMQNIYLDVLKILKKDITFNLNKAYLIGIAKHKVKDYYRFKYKLKIVSLFSKDSNDDLIENLPSDIDIEKITIKSDDLSRIWNFLKNKKIIIGKIFYLYYYLDLSIKECAKELNISESNVKNYLYRTLHELNDYLLEGDENE